MDLQRPQKVVSLLSFNCYTSHAVRSVKFLSLCTMAPSRQLIQQLIENTVQDERSVLEKWSGLSESPNRGTIA